MNNADKLTDDFDVLDTTALTWFQIPINRGELRLYSETRTLNRVGRKLYLLETQSDSNTTNVYVFDLNLRLWSKPEVTGKIPQVCFNL